MNKPSAYEVISVKSCNNAVVLIQDYTPPPLPLPLIYRYRLYHMLLVSKKSSNIGTILILDLIDHIGSFESFTNYRLYRHDSIYSHYKNANTCQ